MNRPQNRNHKWLHIKFACIAIMLALFASTAKADDFMVKESNYSAMVIDKDRIQFHPAHADVELYRKRRYQ